MHNHHYHRKDHIVTGLFVLGVGALLGYLFAPKSGKENREDIKNWMNNMAQEVHDKMRSARDMSEERYNSLIDNIAYKYKKMQGIKQDELDDFVSDLKMRWARIQDRWNNPPDQNYF
jgi:gas vesicle protein